MQRFAGALALLLLLAQALPPYQRALAASSRNVELVNTIPLSATGKVVISSGYGYAPANDGLHIYDWADATRPRQVGFLALPSGATCVVVEGSLAYVGVTGQYLDVVDVSTPSAPRLITSLYIGTFNPGVALSESPLSMIVRGNRLYVGVYSKLGLLGSGGWLVVVDISKPGAPRKVKDVFGFRPFTIIARGNYLYTAGDDLSMSITVPQRGLQVFDISQPDDPRKVVFLPLQLSNIDISPSGALFVARFGGLLYFDLSSPTAPRQVAEYTSANGPNDVRVQDGYAYVTTSYSEQDRFGDSLRVLDIANPAAPTEVGFYDVGQGVHLIAASNNLAYLQCNLCSSMFVLSYNGTSTISGRVFDAAGKPVAGVQIASSAGKLATSAADGAFALADLGTGTVTLTPTLAGLCFVPPARTLTLPAENAWASFVALPAPVSVAIAPARAGTLSCTDTQGLRTTVEWPAGAVGVSATLLLTPTLVNDGGFRSTGHAFELALSPAISLTGPLTVTFAYSDDDVRSITGGDEKLQVRPLAASSSVCGAPVADRQNNSYKQAVCGAGTYVLAGPTNQVLLPIVAKS